MGVRISHRDSVHSLVGPRAAALPRWAPHRTTPAGAATQETGGADRQAAAGSARST
ncbi:hypothetical protein [Crossiella cryophila]|uniref:Uncharacterized protein n=1 Tax=Crossiella cryophila TaxID=43355 RepID=A0A7W7CAV4_9PSEU|nr:hypothetical protein [Crossiella cryophila]MBB4677772.1 hypothetical protein [Crossiella cryophila]